MDNIQRIAMFGSTPEIFNGLDNSAGFSTGRGLGSAAWIKCVETVCSLEDLKETINQDPSLTQIGKSQKLSRAVRDAEVELTKVGGHVSKLRDEAKTARASYKPQSDESVNSSLWEMLPHDPIATANLYRDALLKKDWRTCNAIESMPSVFEGVPEDLEALRRERIFAEAPDVAKAIDTAEAVVHHVENAHRIAGQHLAEVGKGLPEPDKNKVHTGDDGLRVLSPSEYKEAING